MGRGGGMVGMAGGELETGHRKGHWTLQRVEGGGVLEDAGDDSGRKPQGQEEEL